MQKKSISLALQGGGAHSAFTWGVIDQILLDGRFQIEAVSAVSGGAMMACVLAQGLHDNGEQGARDALQAFWKKISLAASMLPLRMSVVDKFLSNVGLDLSPSTIALDYITRVFSPYQFNLFDLNPVRDIVGEMVDFSMLNRKSPVALYINATHAKTGKGKIFAAGELSLEAVMASSCLPFIFKTVEVDGEPYWDGSFSGCPPLAPLSSKHGHSEIVLVQVHPNYVEDVPTAATDILDRATEISFNAVLSQEIESIERHNQRIKMGADGKAVKLHRIEAQDMLTSLGRASKLNSDWNFLVYLHDLGVQAATDWIESLDKKESTRKTG